MIVRDPENVPEHEALSERTIAESDYSYPSKGGRVPTIILNVPAGTIVLTIFEEVICLYDANCGALENGIFGIVWWVLAAFSIVLGWQGRLWGSRRTSRRR